MGGLIDDDVLNAFAVVEEPDRVAGTLLRRFGDVMTRMSLYLPYESDPEIGARIAADVHSATSSVIDNRDTPR